MTQVNILYFDEAASSSDSILNALHLITATSGGTLKAQPCAPDTIVDHIRADLTGIGFDCIYHKHDPYSYAFYICGADFPVDQILTLAPYFTKYNVQLHILTT